MKKLLVTALLTATVAGGTAQVKNQSHGYPIDPVPFTSVKVTDSFWGQRLNASLSLIHISEPTPVIPLK